MAASGGVARGRLAEERKSWRKSHPHGFVAKPETLPDGTVNLMVWKCVVPGKEGSVVLPDAFGNLLLWNSVITGKEGLRKKNINPFVYAGTVTDWEGGYFPVTLHFSENYPSNPPICKFPAKFFHVNVYNCGEVCLSILGGAWKPSITVRQILIGIQDLLDNPNPASAAQDLAYNLFTKNMPEYTNRVRQQAKLYPSLV